MVAQVGCAFCVLCGGLCLCFCVSDDIDSSLADNAVSAVAADLSPSVAAVAAAAADLRLTSSSSSYGMSNKSSGLIQCNDGPEVGFF